jgi:hypothetical protein
MPGPYIHMAVAENVRKALANIGSWSNGATTAGLPSLDGRTPAELAQIAGDHPSYYALGALGPDLFFFLPDFRSICEGGLRVSIANPIIRIVETVDNLYDSFDDWILSRWEYYLGPIAEDVDEQLSRFTGDLTTLVKDVLGGLASIGVNLALDIASQSKDWFSFFSLGLNKGYDNQDFFWSDMLHYRRTSHYARNLWLRAERAGSDALRAYALGYMTHLGADTAGHPFVNEKCGGPYRLHWQRHHLVENHMDAQTYADDYGSSSVWRQYVESGLHYKIAFDEHGKDNNPPLPKPEGETLQALYRWRRLLDLDSHMPDELANLLIDAMGDTYATSTPPTPANASTSSPRILPTPDGRPHNETVKTAYLWWFRYLKRSTADGFRRDKPSPPDLFPNLDPPLATDPHDEPPGPANQLPVVDAILKLLRLALWLVACAVWFVTFVAAVVFDAATYVPRLIAYYALELPIYYILKAERRILVVTSYLHPTTDEIDIGLVKIGVGHEDAFLATLDAMNDALAGFPDDLIDFINRDVQKVLSDGVQLATDAAGALEEAIAIVLGRRSTTFSEPPPNSNYPHAHAVNSQGQSIEHHAPWRYPSTPTELESTFAGPYQIGDMPHILLDGAQPGSQQIRMQFENAPSPIATNVLAGNVTATDHLGDPVNLSQYLMWQLTRVDPPPFTDWNLDADRGYAYKCWDWNRHDDSQFLFRDQDGHQYLLPCTPPPQQEQATPFNSACGPFPKERPRPDVPLKLHWADSADPHCGDAPQLAVFLKSRIIGTAQTTVTLGVANSGTATAANVVVTIGAISPTGVTVTPPSISIAAVAGGTVAFVNFVFSTATPFQFSVTVTAGTLSVTTTIHVS